MQMNSFIPDIHRYIAPLQVHYYSELLPTTVGFEPATFRAQGTKLTTPHIWHIWSRDYML